ncbi:MAG TPA: hypothetical protein VHZ55_09850 [Bryobacteraceae bacterium]|nr:hypothetical protein [Bryobacteraceae bacterium]
MPLPAFVPSCRDRSSPKEASLFHLEANITEGRQATPYATIQMDWISATAYREIIRSADFNSVRVSSTGRFYEKDSARYVPLIMQTLTTAMLDPKPIVDAIQEGDRVLTKSNGSVDESGVSCFDAQRRICVRDPSGLKETVAASGHAVTFGNYQPFGHKRIARVITNAPRLGEDLYTLTVTQLKEIDKATQIDVPDDAGTGRIEFQDVSEAELRSHLVGSPSITWPQPLDGAEKGPASFFVSIDTTGQVREVQQLYTVNERTNDSAMNQLMRWHFKPFAVDDKPMQTSGVLRFMLNTREFGPKTPITNADARKLVADPANPRIQGSAPPPGTTYSLWASVDSDGHVIEIMAGDGPNELFIPCMQAVQSWQFKPLTVDGTAVPFRANLVFHF